MGKASPRVAELAPRGAYESNAVCNSRLSLRKLLRCFATAGPRSGSPRTSRLDSRRCCRECRCSSWRGQSIGQLRSGNGRPPSGGVLPSKSALPARTDGCGRLSAPWMGSGFIREAAVRLLARNPPPEALPFLVLRTADWVPQVRQCAEPALEASCLGRSPAELLPALEVALELEDRSSGPRTTGARFLHDWSAKRTMLF
jgi:hypothetical protein